MNVGIATVTFESDMMMSQFFDMLRPSEASGEHRLMAAVLEDALHCWIGAGYAASGPGPTDPPFAQWQSEKRGRLRAEADAWIFGGYPAPFSFAAVCDALGLEPDYIRKKLREAEAGKATAIPGRWVQGNHSHLVKRTHAGLRTKCVLAVRERH
jgi:hypothetical protein